MDTQQLEFINLPSSTQTAVFKYRLQGSDGGWATKTLNKAGDGFFYSGNRDIPAGSYEYELLLDGAASAFVSGTDLVMGIHIGANNSVSIPTVDSEDDNETITPMSSYLHDAYGNVVKDTRYANSAQISHYGELNVVADNVRDHTSYTFYDAHSRQVALQDGEGNSRYMSYDAAGNVAKEWQWITVTESGFNDQLYSGTTYQYDAVGQPIDISRTIDDIVYSTGIEHSRGADLDEVSDRHYARAVSENSYNAFGEITQQQFSQYNGATLQQSVRQEYYDYDNAGRLWRTNSQDGIDKIYLYNLQGNQVQSIISQSVDLSLDTYGVETLNAAALFSADIQKTSQYYDALGRVTRQLFPSWTQDSVSYQADIEQTHDRWGNVVRHVDKGGTATKWRYDSNNHLRLEINAADTGVTIVDEHGVATTGTPTTQYYFDAFGRQMGRVDANDHASVTQYNEAGLAERTIDGAGGVQRVRYDTFSNAIETILFMADEEAPVATRLSTLNVYDRNNRVISEYAPGGGETHFTYNEAGQKISERRLVDVKNNISRYQVSEFVYDNRGNLLESKQAIRIERYDENGDFVVDNDPNTLDDDPITLNGDHVTRRYHYDLNNQKVSEWRYLSANEKREATWSYDGFGRLQSHTDVGNGISTTSYNHNGQVVQESVSRNGEDEDKVFVYYQDGQLQSLTANGVTETYQYDLAGNTTSHVGTEGGNELFTNTYQYDDLGRMTQFDASGGDALYGESANFGYHLSLAYTYDAQGNRRSVVGDQGKWFESLEESQLIYGPNGWETITYDVGSGMTSSGEAINQWYTYDGSNRVLISRGQTLNDHITVNGTQDGLQASYDMAGNRQHITGYRDGTWISEGHLYDDAGRVQTTTSNGQTTSERYYDTLGRVVQMTTYHAPGSPKQVQVFNYDETSGRLIEQHNYTADINGSTGAIEAGILDSRVRYTSFDAEGNVLSYALDAYGESSYTNAYRYDYQWFDEANVAATHGTSSHQSLLNNTTTQTYDAWGNLLSVSNSHADQWSANRDYTLSAQGNVLMKAAGDGTEVQFYYTANGHVIGSGGNLDKTDFDYSITPLSDGNAVGITPRQHIASAGETLQGVALATYGDAALWYVIADANGLSSASPLTEGQVLQIPTNVASMRNSTEAFKPFNAGEMIGNTTPELPVADALPLSRGDSGQSSHFVQLIAIIVAVVVTVYTAGALSPAGGSAAGAWMVGGMAGSIASQSVLVGGGVQEDINWGAVAVSAASAGITGGNGGLIGESVIANETGRLLANTALNNVINQGIGILGDQQDSFSWEALAAAVVAAPINNRIDNAFGTTGANGPFMPGSSGHFGNDLAAGFLKGGVSNAARMLTGDTGKMQWTDITVNAIGQAIGNSLVNSARSRPTTHTQQHPQGQGSGSIQSGQGAGQTDPGVQGQNGVVNVPNQSDITPPVTLQQDMEEIVVTAKAGDGVGVPSFTNLMWHTMFGNSETSNQAGQYIQMQQLQSAVNQSTNALAQKQNRMIMNDIAYKNDFRLQSAFSDFQQEMLTQHAVGYRDAVIENFNEAQAWTDPSQWTQAQQADYMYSSIQAGDTISNIIASLPLMLFGGPALAMINGGLRFTGTALSAVGESALIMGNGVRAGTGALLNVARGGSLRGAFASSGASINAAGLEAAAWIEGFAAPGMTVAGSMATAGFAFTQVARQEIMAMSRSAGRVLSNFGDDLARVLAGPQTSRLAFGNQGGFGNIDLISFGLSKLFSRSIGNSAPGIKNSLNLSGSASRPVSLTRESIVGGLTGFTQQGNRVAAGIRNGDIQINVLSDQMLQKAYALYGGQGAAPQAFQVGRGVYLNKTSNSLLTDTVHEGTHVLDEVGGLVRVDYNLNPYAWEKRAFFYERQFQLAKGETPEFSSIQEMLDFIYRVY
jgi:YD repeat-containing protein